MNRTRIPVLCLTTFPWLVYTLSGNAQQKKPEAAAQEQKAATLSSRVTTQSNGTVCYDADFYPYGGERAYMDSCPSANVYKFEGKERDTETGNDDFGARYYSNRFGRWQKLQD